MFPLKKRIEIDAGHRIPLHDSKCRNLHGHRYGIEAVFTAESLIEGQRSDKGMVLDFGFVKKGLVEVIERHYDHRFMLYRGDPFLGRFSSQSELGLKVVPVIPTAENLAALWYNELVSWLEEQGRAGEYDVWRECGLRFLGLFVDETPTCRAGFMPGRGREWRP